MSDVVTRLRERRDQALMRRKQIVDTGQRERRTHLTEAEDVEFRQLTRDLREIDERITELTEEERHSSLAAAAMRSSGGGRSTSHVYGPESRARSSYFADLVAVQRQTADYEQRQRLHEYELEQRDLNRADGTGGYAIPPAFLLDEFVGLPRAGRVTADLLTRRPLPPGTDSINIPKIATGTATAIQPQDNDPVQETDLTDSVLTAPVRTLAGQQDVAIQLLDQSPMAFDELVARDLMSSYRQQLDNQVLSGAGTS